MDSTASAAGYRVWNERRCGSGWGKVAPAGRARWMGDAEGCRASLEEAIERLREGRERGEARP